MEVETKEGDWENGCINWRDHQEDSLFFFFFSFSFFSFLCFSGFSAVVSSTGFSIPWFFSLFSFFFFSFFGDSYNERI